MAQLKPNYLIEVAKLNDQLFNAEAQLERLKIAMRSNRYYYAANVDETSLHNLEGAIKNYHAQQQKVQALTTKFEELVNNWPDYME